MLRSRTQIGRAAVLSAITAKLEILEGGNFPFKLEYTFRGRFG